MTSEEKEPTDTCSAASETVVPKTSAEKTENGVPYANNDSKTSRYWAIIVALCVMSLLVALEGTVISTALPSITRELGGSETYVWVINAYFLSR